MIAKTQNHLHIPGINIQWPWSALILSGRKTVETRNYPLPIKYLNQPLAIIETPGKEGKQNGITSARIIGVIVFSDSVQYQNRKDWLADAIRHRVPVNDQSYKYNSDKKKWAWTIKSVRPLKRMVQELDPKSRGIIFASVCRIPISSLLENWTSGFS